MQTWELESNLVNKASFTSASLRLVDCCNVGYRVTEYVKGEASVDNYCQAKHIRAGCYYTHYSCTEYMEAIARFVEYNAPCDTGLTNNLSD